MNTITPTGGLGLTELLIHAGYILTAAAFLLRDILWLRLLAIAANFCVGLAAYRAGMDPRWVVVAWRKAPLERLLARQPVLLNVFLAAVGKDLAAKVASHNVALSQV
jgi:hypothetical protein